MIDDLQIRAAVHLSSTAVQTVVGYIDPHDAKLKIMAISHEDTNAFFGGQILDYQELLKAIKLSVRQASDMINMDFFDVGLSFSTPAMISSSGISRLNLTGQRHFNSKGRRITADDVKNILISIEESFTKNRYSLIQLNTQFMMLDNDKKMLKDGIGMSAHQLSLGYHFNCVPNSYFQQMNNLFAESKLGIYPPVFSGVASAEYALYFEEKQQGVCFIDIGASNTNVCIYYQGMLVFSHCFEMGGFMIDQAIAEWLNISLEEAEDLKKRYGSAYSQDVPKSKIFNFERKRDNKTEVIFYPYQLASYIEEEYYKLIDKILDQLKHKKLSYYIDAGIVLSGGGSQMTGLKTLIEKKFNISVRKSSQNHTVGVCAKYLNDDNIRLVNDCLKNSKFNNVIGALLYQYSEQYQKDEKLRYPKEQPEGLFKRAKNLMTQFDKFKNWM